MKVDNILLAVRPMNTNQAIDLGIMMARHWFFPLWKLWVGMALPVMLLVFIATGVEYYVYMSFIVADEEDFFSYADFVLLLFFILKPIYEQALVVWLGNAVFSNEVRVKEALKSSYRNYFQNFFKVCIRYRLQPTRQTLLPILLLEKPTANKLSNRIKLINRGQANAVGWSTIILMHIEVILCVGFLAFIAFVVPRELFTDFYDFFFSDDASYFAAFMFNVIFDIVYFMVLSIIAPFFICSGFAIYLTKRCLLEGWDVELVFKQLAKRYQQAMCSPISLAKNIQTPINTVNTDEIEDKKNSNNEANMSKNQELNKQKPQNEQEL